MKEDEALLLITKTFNERPGSIGLDTLKDDIPNWDSIGTISLMAELDEQFGVFSRKRRSVLQPRWGHSRCPQKPRQTPQLAIVRYPRDLVLAKFDRVIHVPIKRIRR